MVKFTDIDPIAEAHARVALKYRRAKPAHRGAPPLGTAVNAFVRANIPEPGPGLARLKAQWSDIVGQDLAAFCRPEKLSGKKGERVLTVKVIPQAAPLIQHRGGEIRQRVSAAAGGTVARLKLVQGPLNAPNVKPVQLTQKPLSPEAVTALEASVANIEDSKLRAAIVALGKVMLSRNG